MTTEQTAQQLELAAQILRTGHPFMASPKPTGLWCVPTQAEMNVLKWPVDKYEIRPILATPPDNRQLHNPDNLTAEAVGVGYRLALPGESAASPHDFWDGNTWKKAKLLGPAIFAWCCRSCRLPLSVPWPEPADPYAELKAAHAAGKVIQYRATRSDWSDWPKDQTPDWLALNTLWRIKPTESAKPEPAFQLPPPPPGMRWHREDGWKADDLPQGYRPLVDGEKWVAGDEILRFAPHGWQIGGMPGDILDEPTHGGTSRCRTTRPLTFEHAGKTWTYHRPGDPMPCDRDSSVNLLCRDEQCFAPSRSLLAKNVNWDECCLDGFDVLGWRYADEKKTVPLGPEDVPPGSVFRLINPVGRTGWLSCAFVMEESAELLQSRSTFNVTFGKLLGEWQINRSIPLTGKWNPDAWEPCSKTIPA